MFKFRRKYFMKSAFWKLKKWFFLYYYVLLCNILNKKCMIYFGFSPLSLKCCMIYQGLFNIRMLRKCCYYIFWPVNRFKMKHFLWYFEYEHFSNFKEIKNKTFQQITENCQYHLKQISWSNFVVGFWILVSV